jgi:hypothetical protein
MSITLTNPVTVTAGASTIESDLSSAITFVWIDFVNNILGIIMQNGTVSGSSFTPGAEVPAEVQCTMNLTTGAWTTTTGLSGTANPAVLAAQVAQFQTSRNGGEQFMLAIGAVSGTYTAWATS